MMGDCRTRDAEDVVIRLSNKDVGVGAVVGNDAAPNEHVGPRDVRRIAAVHIILHLSADAAARLRVEGPTVDVGRGGTPELVVHLVADGAAIDVRYVRALVVIHGVSASAARSIFATAV